MADVTKLSADPATSQTPNSQPAPLFSAVPATGVIQDMPVVHPPETVFHPAPDPTQHDDVLVSDIAASSDLYPLESLEVHEKGQPIQLPTPIIDPNSKPLVTMLPEQPNQAEKIEKAKRVVPFSRARATRASILITLLVVLITGGSAAWFLRQESGQKAAQIPSQDLNLQNVSSFETLPGLEGSEESLVVKGDLITRGSLKLSDGTTLIVLRVASGGNNLEIGFPGGTKTLCFNDNNCNYITPNQLQTSLSQILIPPASLVNGVVGDLTLKGTTNQISVTTAGGIVTLATPQAIAATSSPIFAGLSINGNVSVTGIVNLPLNCTTYLNGGALTTDTSGNIVCTDDEISGGGTSVTTSGGTSGTIPVFSAADQIADSIISQALGTITVGGNLTVNSTLTLAALTNGFLEADGSGVISIGTIDLGVDTAGNYVSAIGSVTGLTVGSNSGEGSTPTLSVNYGSTANTAVQGNTGLTLTAGTGLTGGATITLGSGGSATFNVAYGSSAGTAAQGNVTITCAAGTGNLTGGGNSIAVGAGGTCNTINTVNNPTFTTSITTPQLIFTGAGSNGTVQIANLGQPTTYTLPDPGAGTATICLSTNNCTPNMVNTSGGTTNRLAVFTGAQAIGNSWFLQNSSTLELDNTRNLSLLGGNLNVAGNGLLTGDLTVDTNTLFVDSVNNRVGIGDTSPAALLTVGSGDLFQVNSSGAITAATGIATTGNVLQSGTGTFGTGTGAVSLNGDTTIAATKTLTVTSGAVSFTGASTGDALTVSNDSSTGNIFVAKDNTTTVFTIADGGNITATNDISIQGNTTLGNAAGDTLTIHGTAVSIPNNLNIDNNTFFIDSTNNRVGIGIGAPGNRLEVTDTNSVNSGTNITNLTTMTVAPSSAPGAVTVYNGLRGVASGSSANINANTAMFGTMGISTYGGTGTLSTGLGLYGQSLNTNSGTVTIARGVVGQIVNSGSGTIGEASSLYATGTTNSGGGTITNAYGVNVANQGGAGVQNAYGVYIQAQSGASTDNYGLYSAGGTNYFAGNVGIGTTTPTSFKLEVAGNVGPEADNTRDLGSAVRRWANVYATNIAGTVTPTGFTQGSVAFAGTGGVLSQDNANFFWDDANNRLGIGTASPARVLDVVNASNYSQFMRASSSQANVLSLANSDTTDGNGVILRFGGGVNGDTGYADIRAIYTTHATLNTELAFSTRTAGAYTEKLRIDENGNVGIGTSSPTATALLNLSSDSSTKIHIDGYSNGGATASPGLVFNRANGTAAVPLQVGTNDRLGIIEFRGYNDSAGFSNTAAAITAYAAEPFTSSATGAYLRLETTPIGSTTRAERLRVAADGNIGIGTTSPTATLHTVGSAGTSSGATTMSGTSGTTTLTTSSSITLNAGDYVVPTTSTGQARAITTTATGTSFTVSLSFSATVTGETFTIYRPVASLETNTNGAGLAVQGSTGNVGIGTVSPSQKLFVQNSPTDPLGQSVSGYFDTNTVLTANNSSSGASTGAVGDGSLDQAGFNATATLGLRGVSGIARALGASGTITGQVGVLSVLQNQGAGTVTNAYGFYNNNYGNTGGGTVVNNYGFYAAATSTGSNIYGFYSDIASSTNRYNFYASGTAQNYFAGNVGIGTTTPATKLDVVGPNAAQLRLRNNETDATLKNGYIQVGHYTNAEEDVSAILVNGGVASNVIHVGGGSGALNAATDIRFYTAANNTTLSGTERLRIESNGNVGIGDSDPLYALTVGSGDLFGVTNTADLIFEGSTADANELTITVANPTADRTYTIPNSSSATDSFCLLTLGNCFGAGTGGTLQAAYDAGNTISSAAYSGGRNLDITLADTTTDSLVRITQAGTANAFEVHDDGTFADTTPFVVASNGAVGVGTASPLSLLHVAGGAQFGTAGVTDGTVNIYRSTATPTAAFLTLANYDATDGNGSLLRFSSLTTGAGATERAIAYVRSTTTDHNDATRKGNLLFDTSNGGGPQTRMFIQYDGNVGIGTTTPTSFKLEVAGSVGPEADNTRDLGSAVRRWANVYATNVLGAVTPTGFTQGSVVFAGTGGTLTQDNAQFFWDDTNDRLGIGTTTLTHKLQVESTSSNTTGGGINAGRFQQTWTNSGAVDPVLRGFQGTVVTNLASGTLSGTVSAGIVGNMGTVTANGAGTYSSYISGTGGVVIRDGGPSTGNMNAFMAYSPILLNGGTIATANGLYIAQQKYGGGPTVGYGINQVGTQDLNFFAGNLGIGSNATTPGSKLYVSSGSAGAVTAHTGADEAVFEHSSAGGISILTPDASTGSVYFGSPTDNAGAGIEWNHNSGIFEMGPSTATGQLVLSSGNSVEAIRVNSSGNVGIGETTGLAKLSVMGRSGFTATGTVSTSASSATVTGSSTSFTTEVAKGDTILINGETKLVLSVASNTSLTADSAFTGTNSGVSMTVTGAILRVDDASDVQKLAVTSAGALRVGSLGVSGGGAANVGEYLNVSESFTTTSNVLLSNNMLVANPSGTTASTYRALIGDSRTDSSNSQNLTSAFQALQGVVGFARHLGTGVVTTAVGTAGQIQNTSSGTISTATGVNGSVSNSSSGVVTNAYAFNGSVTNTATSGGGTIPTAIVFHAASPTAHATNAPITNAYGLYLESQDVSGVGTGYGVYQAGTADLNYFAGQMLLGSSTSTSSALFQTTQSAIASTGEILADFRIADNATSRLRINNSSSTDAIFAPRIDSQASGTSIALTVRGSVETDSTATPVISLDARTNAGGSIATRPILEVSNNGGTAVLHVAASGNVGIGDITPTEGRLVVGANTTTNELIAVKSALSSGIELLGDGDNDVSELGTAYLLFSQDNSSAYSILGTIQNAGVDSKGNTYTGTLANSTLLAAGESGDLHLGTADNVRLTIDNTGHIGIGDTTPDANLQVYGGVGGETILHLQRIGPNVDFKFDGSTGDARFIINDASTTWIQGIDTSDSSRFKIDANTALGGLAAITIDPSTKNVGLGTSLAGSINAKLSLSSDVTAQKLLMYDNGNARYGFGIQSNEMRTFAASGAILSFGHVSTGDGTTYTERMRMDANGGLGIGTAPYDSLKLDVAGGGRFSAPASSTASGTAAIAATTAVTGTSTSFNTELVVGDRITINSETRTVVVITSATSMTVDVAFTTTASGQTVTIHRAALSVVQAVNNSTLVASFINSSTASTSQGVLIDTRSGNAGTVGLRVVNSSNNREILSTTGAGNVGIGVLAPDFKLDIQNGAVNTTQLHFGEAATVGGFLTSTTDGMAFVSGGASFSGSSWTARSTEASVFGSNSASGIQFYTDDTLTVGSPYTPTLRMTIGTGGNVGIGGTNSTAIFSVQGSGAAADADFARIKVISSDNQAGISFLSDNSGEAVLYSPDGSDDLRFYLGSDKIAIATTGMLGINDMTPTEGNLTVAQITNGDTLFYGRRNTNTGPTGNFFQFQSATSADIATLDVSGNLTVVTATINGNLTVNGHLITGNTSGTTTVAAGAATTCTGGSPSASLSGNDTSGTLTFVTGGSGCAAGVLGTVTFANAYGAAPRVILTPAGANATTIQWYTNTSGTTTFTVDTNNAATAGTTYKYNYQIMQ